RVSRLTVALRSLILLSGSAWFVTTVVTATGGKRALYGHTPKAASGLTDGTVIYQKLKRKLSFKLEPLNPNAVSRSNTLNRQHATQAIRFTPK
ncbi:MAG: hypothetical protein P1U52_12125, partial [Porticoccaceae bacterium]|nr:hypothetical protein [Porticoccaceae bacterium]